MTTPIQDILVERQIDAEYKIWKKNTPYLYDFVLTHSLEWPSLTCQWLPTTSSVSAHATSHQLLLGTHTAGGDQNYLLTASCVIPGEEEVIAQQQQQQENKQTTNAAATAKKTGAPHYDEERKELGGFGHANSNVGKIEIKMKIKHEGEVNRARFMPQNVSQTEAACLAGRFVSSYTHSLTRTCLLALAFCRCFPRPFSRSLYL